MVIKIFQIQKKKIVSKEAKYSTFMELKFTEDIQQ